MSPGNWRLLLGSLLVLVAAAGQDPKSLDLQAQLYRAEGRYADAEPLFKRSLAIREQALGPEHPDVAMSLNNLALLYRVQGRYAEAEPLYQRSLAIWVKALGAEHPNVAMSLNNLAELYQAQGQYAEAEALSPFGPEGDSEGVEQVGFRKASARW